MTIQTAFAEKVTGFQDCDHRLRTRTPQFDFEVHQVYDAQLDDLLATAWISNGKKHGSIWDQSYEGQRFFKDGDASWEAAITYMDELMTDPRKQ